MADSKPVKISKEKHEELRKEAFNKRTTMKDILEKALENYFDSE